MVSKKISINNENNVSFEEKITINENSENLNIDQSKLLKLDSDIYLENKKEKIISNKTNRINSIKFDIDNTEINLILNMTHEIDYLVYGLSNPDRTVIEIENTQLGFRLEELVPVDPIVAIRYSVNENNRFKLVLESENPLSIKKSMASSSDTDHNLIVMMKSQWQYAEVRKKEEFNLSAIVEEQITKQKDTVFKGEIVKTPVNAGYNAYADKLFQEAFLAYKGGDISESLKKLNMSLNQFAGHVKARSTLAMILSKQDHLELAYSVLNEGLIQYPDQTEWISMYSKLLLHEGKLIESYSMLEKHMPELSSDTDYYALKAAVSQKLNKHEDAAKIYQKLLKVNLQKSLWWMGLGISLETLKRYNDALYAYQKASNNSSLAQDSQKFLYRRINRLSNLLADESS